MLIIYSFDKSNQHKKDLHQLTLQGKNYERPLVTSELILLYRESNDKKPHIAYLKTYIHRDSLFNEIEGTFKNGYYYIDFDKNTHWYNIEDQYKGMYKGGWLKMSEIKMGSVKREVYEKRKPKVRKTPDR